MFLVKGTAQRPSDAEVEQMQKEHLGNFGKQYEAKRLVLAGPLRDPTGLKRGIVAFNVPTYEDVMACFKPDPYVQTGLMEVQAWPWDAPRAGIASEFPDPNSLEENRVAFIEATKTVPDYLLKQQATWLAKKSDHTLGGALEGDRYRAVLFYKGSDRADEWQANLMTSPLVRLGFAQWEFMPQWMAKDAIRRAR